MECTISSSSGSFLYLLSNFGPNSTAIVVPYQGDTRTDPGSLVETVTSSCSIPGVSEPLTATASYTTFFYTVSINFTKTGPATAKIGDVITYTFTITNTSSAYAPPLTCRLWDSLLGFFPEELALTIDAGQTSSRSANYTVLATDPNPLVNNATVTCLILFADGSISVSRNASHSTTLQ